MVFVSEVEFLARFAFTRQAHQIDAELRMRAPEIGSGGDGFAVELQCLLHSAG